jgi:hypothetical protein
MPALNGASKAATGSIASNTASLLSFADEKSTVILNNQSGQKAYFKLNDAATPVVSATVYDVAIADGGAFIVENASVTTVGVFVAATSGIRVVGWD